MGDYPKECELEADVVSPDFYQGNEGEEHVMKTTRAKLDVNEDDANDQSDNDDTFQFVNLVRQTTFMSGFTHLQKEEKRLCLIGVHYQYHRRGAPSRFWW